MGEISEIFSNFFEWMGALSPLWIYVVIFVIAYGENVVPPIPGDMVVVFGGYLAGVGKLDFWLVVLLSTVAGALGFMTMFLLGKSIGEAVLDPQRLRWLPKEQIRKAQQWIERWGYGVVAANRFLSGARSVISITVGMACMPAPRVALLATFSAAVWTLLIAYLGYAVGENWEVVGVYLRDYGRIMVGLLLLVALFLVVRWLRNKKLAREYEERG